MKIIFSEISESSGVNGSGGSGDGGGELDGGDAVSLVHDCIVILREWEVLVLLTVCAYIGRAEAEGVLLSSGGWPSKSGFIHVVCNLLGGSIGWD